MGVGASILLLPVGLTFDSSPEQMNRLNLIQVQA
jgi:hypothetical protein